MSEREGVGTMFEGTMPEREGGGDGVGGHHVRDGRADFREAGGVKRNKAGGDERPPCYI